MCVGQRRRSIWRIKQTFALKDVRLVLFLDQRRLVYLVDSLPVAARESEVGTRLGVWNSRNRHVDRDSVFLGRPQQNGSCRAGRTWLSDRNVEQRSTHHAPTNRPG